MKGKGRKALLTAISVVCLSGLSLAASEGPMAFIRHTTQQILQVFTDPRLQGEAKREERLARLRHIADTAFDWEEIARRALAVHWRERTPQERREFVDLFRESVQRMYLDRLEAAARQRLQEEPVIRYLGEEVDGQRAVVRTTAGTRRYRDVPMDYRLRYVDGQWRIYDVVITGVSLVNNFRAQFHRIITQSSYEELVRQLQERQLEGTAESPNPTPEAQTGTGTGSLDAPRRR